MKTITKSVEEYLTAYLNFADVLEEYDSLAAVSVTTSSASITATTNTNFAPIVGLDSSNNPIYSTDGRLVEVHVSAGVSGILYSVQVIGVTTVGYKYVIPFLVIVE